MEADGGPGKQIARLEVRRRAAIAAGNATAQIDAEIAELHEEQATLEAIRQGKLPDTIAGGDNPAGRNFADAINRAWRKALEKPPLLVYKIQTSAYKFSWLLIPISVPFVWLLFPFSRWFHLYDHTVFATYSITFVLFLLALQSLGALWGWTWLAALPGCYVPLHMYRQLRGTYGVSRSGALWRTALLALFACFALALFVVTTVMMAV